MNREDYKIEINTPDSGYEPFPVSIMNRSTYEAMTFDPSIGKPSKISYRLNKAGCIRIRIVHRKKQNLLVKTLQDWTHQEFGKYELFWDGCDTSGNIVDNKKMLILFEAKDQGKGLTHKDHSETICRDPLLMIKTGPDASRAVKGIFEIRTSLVGKTSGFINEFGGEVRCFINYDLFKTEKFDPGIKKFICKIDTTRLENGEHLISINVDDFHDHIGSAGVKIKVEN